MEHTQHSRSNLRVLFLFTVVILLYKVLLTLESVGQFRSSTLQMKATE